MWVKHFTSSYRPYYTNTSTNVVQWAQPPDFIDVPPPPPPVKIIRTLSLPVLRGGRILGWRRGLSCMRTVDLPTLHALSKLASILTASWHGVGLFTLLNLLLSRFSSKYCVIVSSAPTWLLLNSMTSWLSAVRASVRALALLSCITPGANTPAPWPSPAKLSPPTPKTRTQIHFLRGERAAQRTRSQGASWTAPPRSFKDPPDQRAHSPVPRLSLSLACEMKAEPSLGLCAGLASGSQAHLSFAITALRCGLLASSLCIFKIY